MLGGVDVANVSSLCTAADEVQQKLMELQSRVDMLDVHENGAPKIECKNICTSIVFVIIVFVVLILTRAVAIAVL